MKRISPLLTVSALTFLAAIATAPRLHAQIQLTDTYEQIFDSLGIPPGGAAGTTSLPENWRVDAKETVRTLGTWSTSGTMTTRNGGDNVPNTNGIYNFGSPTRAGADSTDRSIGFYGNNSGTVSGNLYAQFQNRTGKELVSLQLSYDVENFRNGTVEGGTAFQLYYSLDGENWVSAGENFYTVYSGAETAGGFNPAPGASVTVNDILTFGTPIAEDATFYLAWNYSNAISDSAGSGYALAINNFVAVVPEPGTTALLLVPAALAGYVLRRHR